MNNAKNIHAAVAVAFKGRPVGKATIIDVAERSLASQPVMQALHQLPDISYRSTQDIWPYLPDIVKGETP